MSNIKKALGKMTHEEREQIKQYATSIKEIKAKMEEMINNANSGMKEGGNMSSGLVLSDEGQ